MFHRLDNIRQNDLRIKMTLSLTPDEIYQITGYHQPIKQLAELRRQGFWRARLNRLHEVILEKEHYNAVCGGATQSVPATNQSLKERPRLRFTQSST